MLWLKICETLVEHPKLFRLMSLADLDQDQAIGKLFRFWRFIIKYADDGDLQRFTPTEIDTAVGFIPKGRMHFIDVLIRCAFVDESPYLRVHDWYAYAKNFLIKRYSNTNNEDRPEHIKRLYKLGKSHRTGSRPVTGRKYRTGYRPVTDRTQTIRVEQSRAAKQSRSSGRSSRNKKAEGANGLAAPLPENGGAENGGDIDPRIHERILGLKAFIRKTAPGGFADIASGIDSAGQSIDLAFVLGRLGSDSEIKAAWTLFISEGTTSYEYARAKHFSVTEFRRQLDALIMDRYEEYSALKRKFSDEQQADLLKIFNPAKIALP